MEVKDILRNRRIELGMTMKELATKVGVSEGTISRWESGDIANMRRDKIALLAQALHISPEVIMEWEPMDNHLQYYTDPETAKKAQEMFDDPDMRALYDMKRNMDPQKFQAHIDMMKRLYELENGLDDTGC